MWALNALARCGSRRAGFDHIVDVLKKHSHHPPVAAAAIAALSKIKPDDSDIGDSLSLVEPNVRVLASLQHLPPDRLDTSSLPIDVDRANAEILKLGLIVVGLNRAPSNLFHPRHSNAQLVKALGTHQDPIVVQYSVWAVSENRLLTSSDLGVPLESIESQPPNVRAWMYRVLAMSDGVAARNIDLIVQGAGDPDPEVRLGLAIGIRDTFFDGLEAIILDWFISEADIETSQALLDHVVRQAAKSLSYEDLAVELYERESPKSFLRGRMEAHAVKTSLYSRLRAIAYDGGDDLFTPKVIYMNNTIKGNVYAGAVSVGGNASNTMSNAVHIEKHVVQAVQSQLTNAMNELKGLPIQTELKKAALDKVDTALQNPSMENFRTALDVLEKADSAAKKISSIGASAQKLGAAIAAIGVLIGLG